MVTIWLCGFMHQFHKKKPCIWFPSNKSVVVLILHIVSLLLSVCCFLLSVGVADTVDDNGDSASVSTSAAMVVKTFLNCGFAKTVNWKHINNKCTLW